MSEIATTQTTVEVTGVGTATDAAPAVALYEPAPVGPEGRALPIDALRDVELSVEVILGRARMTLRELLSAQPHTTIELDRPIRSPVDVMVNGTLFARGEMVVVGDSEIGVQITEVIGGEPLAAAQS
ncbi:MAG: FliM/FliN family flagellar motor switch protein [Acidimicrobiales bacterium]